VGARNWTDGCYYYTINGQMTLSNGIQLAAKPGGTITQNLSMPYRTPAVAGSVRITGQPKDFNSQAYMGVQACPASVTFRMGCASGQEAYEGIGPGSSYPIDLGPGKWTVADYYHPFNSWASFSGAPVSFTAVYKKTLKVNVTEAYQGL
jgi:hypothetical protein